MRKKLSLLLLLLLIPTLAYAWGVAIIGGGQVDSAGGACDTPAESCTGDDDGSYKCGDQNTYTYISTQFIASGTTAICRADLELSEFGTYVGNLTCSIWDDNGGEPGSIVGTGSTNPVSGAQVPATVGTVSFTGIATGALVDTGTYHVVLYSDTIDINNYVLWYYESGDCVASGEEMNRSTDGSTWALLNPNSSFEFQAYE